MRSRVRCSLKKNTEYHQVLGEVPGTRYRWFVCVLVFLLFSRWFCSPSRSSSRFFLRKLHHTTADQNVTWPTYSTADRAISSAQVALSIIKSLVALNHEPLLSAAFTFVSRSLPCASVAGGVSRPRREVLVCQYTTRTAHLMPIGATLGIRGMILVQQPASAQTSACGECKWQGQAASDIAIHTYIGHGCTASQRSRRSINRLMEMVTFKQRCAFEWNMLPSLLGQQQH